MYRLNHENPDENLPLLKRFEKNERQRRATIQWNQIQKNRSEQSLAVVQMIRVYISS